MNRYIKIWVVSKHKPCEETCQLKILLWNHRSFNYLIQTLKWMQADHLHLKYQIDPNFQFWISGPPQSPTQNKKKKKISHVAWSELRVDVKNVRLNFVGRFRFFLNKKKSRFRRTSPMNDRTNFTASRAREADNGWCNFRVLARNLCI